MLLLATGHYLVGGKKEGGGGFKAISDWLEGGSAVFILRYILRGVHWPRWLKYLNGRVQTI